MPRIDNSLKYAGQVTVITAEETPFQFQAQPTVRRDSSRTDIGLLVAIRPDGNVLSILAQMDSGPMLPFLTVDSLAKLISFAPADSAGCRRKTRAASPLLVGLLVPSHDASTGKVMESTRTIAYRSCLGATPLSGEVTVHLVPSTRGLDESVAMEATISGTLSSDSARALPARVRAMLTGSATLGAHHGELSPSSLSVVLDIRYRVENTRVSQVLKQSVTYSMVRIRQD